MRPDALFRVFGGGAHRTHWSCVSMSTLLHPEIASEKDFLPLNGTDYVEFYVGNARQASYFYRLAFGMSLVAYAGPETGVRDRASYVLQQGKIRFVMTTPLAPDCR